MIWLYKRANRTDKLHTGGLNRFNAPGGYGMPPPGGNPFIPMHPQMGPESAPPPYTPYSATPLDSFRTPRIHQKRPRHHGPGGSQFSSAYASQPGSAFMPASGYGNGGSDFSINSAKSGRSAHRMPPHMAAGGIRCASSPQPQSGYGGHAASAGPFASGGYGQGFQRQPASRSAFY
jgi:hypothetical protein